MFSLPSGLRPHGACEVTPAKARGEPYPKTAERENQWHTTTSRSPRRTGASGQRHRTTRCSHRTGDAARLRDAMGGTRVSGAGGSQADRRIGQPSRRLGRHEPRARQMERMPMGHTRSCGTTAIRGSWSGRSFAGAACPNRSPTRCAPRRACSRWRTGGWITRSSCWTAGRWAS